MAKGKNENPTADRPYKVGYRKPPEYGKIKPGERRNPNGRRGNKATKKDDQIDVADILNEPIKVKTKGGKTIEMSPFEAGFRKLLESALKDKNLRSVKDFLEICDDYGVLEVEPEFDHGVVRVPTGTTFEDWQRSQDDPSFTPVTTDIAALIKKHLPDRYPLYLERKAAKRAEEERRAEAEKRSKTQSRRSRLHSKRSGGLNKKTIVRQVAMEKHSVIDGGKKRRLTAVELVLLTFRNMAAANRPRGAFREFLKWDERARPKDEQTGGFLVVPKPLDMDEFDALEMERCEKTYGSKGDAPPDNDKNGRDDATGKQANG